MMVLVQMIDKISQSLATSRKPRFQSNMAEIYFEQEESEAAQEDDWDRADSSWSTYSDLSNMNETNANNSDGLYSAEDGSLDNGDEDLDGDDMNEMIVHEPEVTITDPVLKLEKLATSEDLFDRQTVARGLLEAFRAVVDNQTSIQQLLSLMQRLSDDPEANVKSELMEHVPHLAVFCSEFRDRLGFIIPRHLLPILAKYLKDSNNRVRKTSQAALLVLLEQDFLQKREIEWNVAPVIVALSANTNGNQEHYRTEAISLMSKMAPLLGQELTISLFLQQFSELCVDPSGNVRKVCSSSFGDICTVVGSYATESVLLPKFSLLCRDSGWGVRKNCAEVFMQVSCNCSREVRRKELSSLFVSLLCDDSRWVRMSAFRALGPFISTFADPSVTGLYYSEDGIRVIENADCDDRNGTCDPLSEDEQTTNPLHDNNNVPRTTNCDEKLSFDHHNNNITSSYIGDDMIMDEDELIPNGHCQQPELSIEEYRALSYLNRLSPLQQPVVWNRGDGTDNWTASPPPPDCPQMDDDQWSLDLRDDMGNDSGIGTPIETPEEEADVELGAEIKENGDEVFNSFNFWRIPVLDLELEKEIAAMNGSLEQQYYSGHYTRDYNPSDGLHIEGELLRNMERLSFFENGNGYDSQDMYKCSSRRWNMDKSYMSDSSSIDINPFCSMLYEQDIVPSALLEHFVSMTEAVLAQKTDNEIRHHCAYSLPAVALTLGRKYWPVIKSTYSIVASDMQWKVRRTIAASIHEVAVIIGGELAAEDLGPIYFSLIKDLDEVRVGVLEHLADYLKLLEPNDRLSYLPRLSDFIQSDNTLNWRYRSELVDQIGLLIPLYQPLEVGHFLMPLILKLAADKVARVRQVSLIVVSLAIKCLLNADDDAVLLKECLEEIGQTFAQSRQWNKRQVFVYMCGRILQDEVMPPSKFAEFLLPQLLNMSSDRVPNVRLALARVTSQHIVPEDFYFSPENPLFETTDDACKRLSNDTDSDVRYFANLPPHHPAANDSYPLSEPPLSNEETIRNFAGPWGTGLAVGLVL